MTLDRGHETSPRPAEAASARAESADTDRRAVIQMVFEVRRPPYVPWQFGLSSRAAEKLADVYGGGNLEDHLGNHMLMLRRLPGSFTDQGDGSVRDVFGVVWDRRMDADIGIPSGDVLQSPTPRLPTQSICGAWVFSLTNNSCRSPARASVA